MTESLHLPPADLAPGLHLRAWSRDDIPALVDAWRDPEMHRGMPEAADPFTEADAGAFVSEAGRLMDEGRAIQLAIANDQSGVLLGFVSLTVWAPHHWNIGYWIARQHRGRGLASAAVIALSRWAFGAYPDLQRLSLYTLPGNAASQRVAERAGFHREGVLRAWAAPGGRLQDWVMHSLTRADLRQEA